MTVKRVDARLDDVPEDVTLDELREFLEADNMDVQANPEFKERLRKKLWELLQAQSGGSPPGTRRGPA